MVGKEEPAEESKPVRLGSLSKPEPGAKRLGRLSKVGDLVKPAVKPEPTPDGGMGPGMGVTRGGVKKTKFEPKIPQRRVKKPPSESEGAGGPKAEEEEWTPQSSENPNLHQRRLGAAFQNKGASPAAQVAFGAGASMSSRFGGGESKGSSGGGSSHGALTSRNVKTRVGKETFDLLPEPEKKKEKKMKQRQRLDLTSYYPVTLPSGPSPDSDAFERMDIDGEAELDASQTDAILEPGDEDRVPAAQELGLQTPGGDEKLLFFQLPAHLPVQTISSGGRNSDGPSGRGADEGGEGNLAVLPEGFMGKLMVYKSGKVKLKLGDVVLDAVPGAKCKFYQEVAAINVGSKECHILGSVQQRVVLTPDIDHLLAGIG